MGKQSRRVVSFRVSKGSIPKKYNGSMSEIKNECSGFGRIGDCSNHNHRNRIDEKLTLNSDRVVVHKIVSGVADWSFVIAIWRLRGEFELRCDWLLISNEANHVPPGQISVLPISTPEVPPGVTIPV